MSVAARNICTESDSLITEMKRLAQFGMSDKQIGLRLNKHYKTIIHHRKKHGIESGRSHRAEISQHRRGLTIHKRSYGYKENEEQSQKSRIKHGLNALTPIICRKEDCPYRKTCNIPAETLIAGELCPNEMATIIVLAEGYLRDFDVEQDDYVNLTRIRHLIDVQVKIIRCNKLMAENPEMVQVIYDRNGYPHRRLNPVGRYYLLLLKEQSKVLRSLLPLIRVNGATSASFSCVQTLLRT
jgi:hypothetical protein